MQFPLETALILQPLVSSHPQRVQAPQSHETQGTRGPCMIVNPRIWKRRLITESLT